MTSGNDIDTIRPALPMQLTALDDLIRWLVSTSDQGAHGTKYNFLHESKHIYATLIILPSYYALHGLPLLIYCEHSQAPENNFIRFDIRKESTDNAISFISGFDDRDSNLGYIQYIPVIKLKEIPEIFRF